MCCLAPETNTGVAPACCWKHNMKPALWQIGMPQVRQGCATTSGAQSSSSSLQKARSLAVLLNVSVTMHALPRGCACVSRILWPQCQCCSSHHQLARAIALLNSLSLVLHCEAESIMPLAKAHTLHLSSHRRGPCMIDPNAWAVDSSSAQLCHRWPAPISCSVALRVARTAQRHMTTPQLSRHESMTQPCSAALAGDTSSGLSAVSVW